MKRGQSGNDSSKRVNSTQNQQQDEKDVVVYEDPFVDQYEEEDIVDESQLNEDEVEEMGMEEEEEEKHDVIELVRSLKQVFKIGKDKLEEGEHLDYDNSAYKMYHRLNVDWPCLSFDIVTDNLGILRDRV